MPLNCGLNKIVSIFFFSWTLSSLSSNLIATCVMNDEIAKVDGWLRWICEIAVRQQGKILREKKTGREHTKKSNIHWAHHTKHSHSHDKREKSDSINRNAKRWFSSLERKGERAKMSGLFPLASRAIQSMLLALSRLNSFCPYRGSWSQTDMRSRFSLLICIRCDLTVSIW